MIALEKPKHNNKRCQPSRFRVNIQNQHHFLYIRTTNVRRQWKRISFTVTTKIKFLENNKCSNPIWRKPHYFKDRKRGLYKWKRYIIFLHGVIQYCKSSQANSWFHSFSIKNTVEVFMEFALWVLNFSAGEHT